MENVDRAFVWMNEGLAENIHVYNNTVFCANAGDRAGALFGAYAAERLSQWIVKDNIFVAPADQPRKLMADERGVPDKILATHNLCINFTAVPEGNLTVAIGQLGLRRKGEKPWPFFAPLESSSVIDRGIDVGLPFSGDAPDLGAYEWDDSQAFTRYRPRRWISSRRIVRPSGSRGGNWKSAR